jgi:hypothetical protein
MLFGKPAALEAHDNSIVAANTENIAVSDVRVAESKSHRLFLVIAKEPAQFSKTVYSAGTEAEPLSRSPASYIDVKLVETVIAIERNPTKANRSAGVIYVNLDAVSHVQKVYALAGLSAGVTSPLHHQSEVTGVNA